jgi:hypothetical protein
LRKTAYKIAYRICYHPQNLCEQSLVKDSPQISVALFSGHLAIFAQSFADRRQKVITNFRTKV